MAKKLVGLPKHQTVGFSDKVLWESVRIKSELVKMSVQEFIELATYTFMNSKDRDMVIARHNLMKELGMK